MLVKICGITRREDAEAAIAAGASALGFIFYPPSPRYVTPERAAEIASGLQTIKVGVFVNRTTAAIQAIMRATKLDVAQIYGGDAPSGRVWRAFRVKQAFSPTSELLDDAEAILLDGPSTGAGFDWALARGAAAQKVIVAGGLDASNVAEAIRTAKPWGVDASSRLESSPGVKDHQKVRDFVQAALEAQ
jgi:phosphoribosylanthranilate isomerase